MRLCRCALAALLLGAALLPVWSLEVGEGRLKLVLHRGIGRFSLYADGIPLFVDQDPRTSGMALLLDNRVYKLGDSGEFKESSEAVPGGARFIWTSRSLTVTQDFSFRGGEAVAVSVTVRSLADRELSVALRFLLDTYLGEAGFPHFRTDRHREINTELSFDQADMPAWLLSRSSRASRAPENPGLRAVLRGEAVTTPDLLVLANWKRLSESYWLYETGQGRTFSELPYSINDSAACLYFGPAPLAAGASRTWLILLSDGREPLAPETATAAPVPAAAAPAAPAPAQPAAVPAAVPPPGAAAAPPPPAPEPAAPASAGPSAALRLGIESDLRALNDLLQKLALKMEAKTPLSEEEQRLMEQAIAEIKKRLESYGD